MNMVSSSSDNGASVDSLSDADVSLETTVKATEEGYREDSCPTAITAPLFVEILEEDGW